MEQTQKLSLIVAVSENGVIGQGGDLPWRLSADLRRFRQLTMGHHIIMGRKTYESIGRLLPGRTTVILSRQTDYQVPGAKMAASIPEAIELCENDPEPFVTGGAQIYRLALPAVVQIFLTRVHTRIEGDTLFPDIDWNQWRCIATERHAADDRNDHDYSFETYHRVNAAPTG